MQFDDRLQSAIRDEPERYLPDVNLTNNTIVGNCHPEGILGTFYSSTRINKHG